MKINFSLILLVFFVLISIGISFKTKDDNKKHTKIIFDKQSQIDLALISINQLTHQNNLLKYQSDLIWEAFALNFGLLPEPFLTCPL